MTKSGSVTRFSCIKTAFKSHHSHGISLNLILLISLIEDQRFSARIDVTSTKKTPHFIAGNQQKVNILPRRSDLSHRQFLNSSGMRQLVKIFKLVLTNCFRWMYKRQSCWKHIAWPRRGVADHVRASTPSRTDLTSFLHEKTRVLTQKTPSYFGKSTERTEMCRPWPRSHLNGPSFMLDYRRNFYRSSVLYNAVGGFMGVWPLCGGRKGYNSLCLEVHGCH